MIPPKTRGPRVRRVTERGGTVIHSNLNDRPAPRAFHSPTDGDKVAEILRLMIGDFYIEATHWPRAVSDQIRIAADVLWDIRDRLIIGETSADDAAIWADQGFAYIDGMMRKRATR